MSEFYYPSTAYCASCDEYFYNCRERRKHIDATESHPRCELCHQRFLNKNALRTHIRTAGHYYCAACDMIFDTAGGLQVHNAVHHDSDGDCGKCKDKKWEDESRLASDIYPDPNICPNTSFEDFDAYDFEDQDELGDPPYEFGAESEDEQLEEGVEEIDEFQCPMCQKCSPNTICSTSCGHLFCAPCIKAVLHYTGMCPVCDEEDDVTQLRRIFLTPA